MPKELLHLAFNGFLYALLGQFPLLSSLDGSSMFLAFDNTLILVQVCHLNLHFYSIFSLFIISCLGEHGSCMLYQNKLLADLFLAFSVAGQLVAIVCLICVLMFFAHALRDDPLPAMTTIDDTINRAVDGEENAPSLFEGQRTSSLLRLKDNLSSEIEPMLNGDDKNKSTVVEVHE